MCKIKVLYRGCRSKAERENIFNNRTARGYTPANPDTTPPTKKEVSDYIAYGEGVPNPNMPEPNDRIPTLVEYTTNFAKAIGFGKRRGGVIQIEINDCYCAPGSVIEDGVMIRRDAPVENVVKL